MQPHVLVVHDRQQPPEYWAGALADIKCRWSAVALGAETALLASADRPDVILLDLGGDNANRCALLRQLQAQVYSEGVLAAVPVIVVLASTVEAEIAESLEAGAADYLVQPVGVAQLKARLQNQFALKRSRAAEQALNVESQTASAEIERLTRALIASYEPAILALRAVTNGHVDSTPPRILLVDDSPSNIHTLVQFLRADYKTLVATSGAVALDIAAREQPELILLDVVMPGMDGHEVCRRLKAEPQTQSIPVIFVTGKNEIEDEMAGFELGAVDYITKPYSLPVVQRRIRTHVDLKRYQDQLQRQTLLDGLTGIPNRRCFEQTMTNSWNLAVRQQSPLSLLMLDIDHFKAYNDRYGHPAGDECLQRVAKALAATVHRKTDLLARYGGEEFVCVLPGTDLAGALDLAEQMRAVVSDLNIPHAVEAGRVSLSLGVACAHPGAGESLALLLTAADQALYRAKQAGRNRVSD